MFGPGPWPRNWRVPDIAVTGSTAIFQACPQPSVPILKPGRCTHPWALPDGQQRRGDASWAPTCQRSAGEGTGDPTAGYSTSRARSPMADQAMKSGISAPRAQRSSYRESHQGAPPEKPAELNPSRKDHPMHHPRPILQHQRLTEPTSPARSAIRGQHPVNPTRTCNELLGVYM